MDVVSGRVPAPPSDLAACSSGRRSWKRVVSEWELSSVELELLVEARRQLNEVDALRSAVARDGATVSASRGQVRTNPALAEVRQARGELRRLLDALGIPGADHAVAGGGGVVTLASRRPAGGVTRRPSGGLWRLSCAPGASRTSGGQRAVRVRRRRRGRPLRRTVRLLAA